MPKFEDRIGVFDRVIVEQSSGIFTYGKRSNGYKLSIYLCVGLFNIFLRIYLKFTYLKLRKH